MSSHVCGELRVDVEFLMAGIAAQRFLTRVNPHVYLQTFCVSELFVAQLASVRLLSGMLLHVILQNGLRVEPLQTHVASVNLVLRVAPQVSIKTLLSAESLVTLLTKQGIRTLNKCMVIMLGCSTMMHFQMILKTIFHVKGFVARITNETNHLISNLCITIAYLRSDELFAKEIDRICVHFGPSSITVIVRVACHSHDYVRFQMLLKTIFRIEAFIAQITN